MIWTALAVLCPPLAVAAVGRPVEALTNALLTLLFYVPGLAHALFVVNRHQVAKRNEALLQAVADFYG